MTGRAVTKEKPRHGRGSSPGGIRDERSLSLEPVGILTALLKEE
jgi:hypothetical protein